MSERREHARLRGLDARPSSVDALPIGGMVCRPSWDDGHDGIAAAFVRKESPRSN